MDFYIITIAIGCSIAGFLYGYHRGSRDALKAFEAIIKKRVHQYIDKETEHGT